MGNRPSGGRDGSNRNRQSDNQDRRKLDLGGLSSLRNTLQVSIHPLIHFYGKSIATNPYGLVHPFQQGDDVTLGFGGGYLGPQRSGLNNSSNWATLLISKPFSTITINAPLYQFSDRCALEAAAMNKECNADSLPRWSFVLIDFLKFSYGCPALLIVFIVGLPLRKRENSCSVFSPSIPSDWWLGYIFYYPTLDSTLINC